MISILKKTGILFILLTLQLAFSSFRDEYINIQGKWTTYTEAKDKDGKTMERDGKTLYRKLTFVFAGAGTQGQQDFIEKEYGMQSADGTVTLYESYGLKGGNQSLFKEMHGGYDFSNDDDLILKIVYGEYKKLDQKAKLMIDIKKDDESFLNVQKQINEMKIVKFKGDKSFSVKWDHNMNGKIEDAEEMKFTAVE